VEKPYGNYII